MTLLYDTLYLFALAVGWPLLVYRRWKRGAGSLALRERLRPNISRPVAGRCFWIHAVSLGEVNAARTLVAALRRAAPDAAVVISSTTATGLRRAREVYADLPVFRFPLDFSWSLNHVFDRVRPSVVVLMELELWPNLMEVATSRSVPVVIANGRMTEGRSLKRFQQPVIRSVARRMFARLAWVGAQDASYAERFALVGVPRNRIDVVGLLKYDTAEIADEIPGQHALATEMGIRGQDPLWVCGSTGPGEEAMLLDVYERLLAKFPTLQLVLAPRRPERFDEVAQLVVARGFACLRRSTGRPEAPLTTETPHAVFLGDTLGELRKFYALATVAFVGRSLVPMGGSDMIEALALGKPCVVGPHTENFAEPVARLKGSGLESAANADELYEHVAQLLADPRRRDRMRVAAISAISAAQGATQRTTSAILRVSDADPAGET